MREWREADEDAAAIERDLEAPLAELRARAGACPDPALWPALDAGVLPDDLATSAAAHLRQCSLCQAVAGDLASDDVAALVSANVVTLPPAPHVPGPSGPTRRAGARFTLWRALPLAAGAVLCVGIAATYWAMAGRSALPEPARSAPAEAVSPAAMAPAYVLPLEKPAIAVRLGSALVWRSDARGQDGDADLLTAAFDAYRSDDYAGATERFSQLASRHPSADAWFYLGASRLLAGQAKSAVEDLRRARDLSGPQTRHEAAWYLAVALERIGAIDSAATELRTVCGARGERQARACEALAALTSTRR
jgi:hypothetical protein